MLPNLRKLQHALVLADIGNFATASNRLHLTQSALTRSIQSLEKELGLVLFDRSQKGANVTPDGKILLEKARVLMRHAGKFSEEVGAIKQLDYGHVSLGFGPGIQSLFLPQLLVEICRRHPRTSIDIEIASAERLLSLVIREQLEFIVADSLHLGLDETGLLEAQPLVTLPVQVYARSGHPLTVTGYSPEQVQAVSEPYPKLYVQFDSFRHHPLVTGASQTSTLIRCNDLASLQDLLLNTDGLLVGIEAMVKPLLEQRKVVSLPVIPPQIESTVSLIRLKQRSFSTPASAVVTWIKQHLRPMAACSGIGG